MCFTSPASANAAAGRVAKVQSLAGQVQGLELTDLTTLIKAPRQLALGTGTQLSTMKPIPGVSFG